MLTQIKRFAGDPFDIYVWATTTVPTWFLNASVGFNRTLVTGTGASPMLRRIVLANNNPASDLAWCDAAAAYKDDLGIRLGGLYSSYTVGFRPYGADFACASMGQDVAPFTAMKVARLTLAHHLGPGGSAAVTASWAGFFYIETDAGAWGCGSRWWGTLPLSAIGWMCQGRWTRTHMASGCLLQTRSPSTGRAL